MNKRLFGFLDLTSWSVLHRHPLLKSRRADDTVGKRRDFLYADPAACQRPCHRGGELLAGARRRLVARLFVDHCVLARMATDSAIPVPVERAPAAPTTEMPIRLLVTKLVLS
jgi:hypothetical protein